MDIKKLDRKALKFFFVKNAIPTEGNFKDLIDGMINQKDDGIVKLPDEPLSLQADGSANSQKKVINFYGSFADPKPAWTLSLNPRVDPNDPASATRPGWSIGDADGNSRLFIDQSTGNVGIGTLDPKYSFEIKASSGIKLGVEGSGGGQLIIANNKDDNRIYLEAFSSDATGHASELSLTGRHGGNVPKLSFLADLTAVSGNVVVNGNVGIGTSEPRSALGISAVTKRQISTNSWADMSASPSGYGLFAGNAYLNHDTKPHFRYASQHDNIGAIGLAVNYPNWNNLSIISSGTTSSKESEDFTPKVLALFTHDGRVGIGTTDPKYSFEIKASSAIKLGLEGYGGGQLIIANNKDDNRIYLEAFSSDGTGHASELLLTGRHAGNVPKLSFFADLTAVSGNVVVDGNVGIGTVDPKAKFEVNGVTVISNGNSVAAGAGLMVSGSLTVGGINTSYGGGQGWISNIAGLLLETAANTEIAVHDSGTRVASLMYYEGDAANRITIGRDMGPGWGAIGQVVLNGKVGIGTSDPKGKLEVTGVAVISNGNCVAAGQGYMASGSLTVGGNNTSYGGGQGWTSNTAGLLLETAANTEIAVHDSVQRVASLMYYEGDAANRITIGRDMGWGAIKQVVLNGNVGIGTDSPAGQLHVQTGGTGNWDKFVVKTTNRWGDGNNQYVTIGEGGASGIMLYNPHVVWSAEQGSASIRMGRSGGVSSGHWWDIGVRGGNSFSIMNGHAGVTGLVIDAGGNVGIGTSDPKAKLDVSGGINMAAQGTLFSPGRMHINGDEILYLLHKKGVIIGQEWGGTGSLNVQGELWAGRLLGVSDLRLKKKVGPLIQAPEDILKLRGVRFKWQDAAEDDPYAMGLVAQEVEEFFPEAVRTGTDGMKGINYSALIAPLIESLKQQQSQIGELRVEIETLRAR